MVSFNTLLGHPPAAGGPVSFHLTPPSLTVDPLLPLRGSTVWVRLPKRHLAAPSFFFMGVKGTRVQAL